MTSNKDEIKFFGIASESEITYGLSNFTPLEVKIPQKFGYFPWTEQDLTFPNAEAAFQALKCHECPDDVKKFLESDNPRRAKGIIDFPLLINTGYYKMVTDKYRYFFNFEYRKFIALINKTIFQKYDSV